MSGAGAGAAAFDGAVPTADIPSSQTAASAPAASHSAVITSASDSGAETPLSPSRPAITRSLSAAPAARLPGSLYPPATLKGIDYAGMPAEPEWTPEMGEGDMVLELADGLALSGHSFGAQRSVAGECVFQTGALAFSILASQMNVRGQGDAARQKSSKCKGSSRILNIQVWSATPSRSPTLPTRLRSSSSPTP